MASQQAAQPTLICTLEPVCARQSAQASTKFACAKRDSLAETNATGVWAHLDVVLGCHEQHREDLGRTSDAARVDLAEFDRREFAFLQAWQLLQQLLENDLILGNFASGHANTERLERLANHPLRTRSRVTKHGRCIPTNKLTVTAHASTRWQDLVATPVARHMLDLEAAYMTNHVITVRGLFDPHRLELCELRHVRDRLLRMARSPTALAQ